MQLLSAGIGAGALSRLNQLGITVYRAQGQTIRENIVLLEKSQLLHTYASTMLRWTCGRVCS